MTAYYNEIDPFAAAWLRELIKQGHIADGIVDERSISDVTPDELKEFTQCHFFAGIGVWSYALRRAGWPDDRPVWTGSCPCQPFSAAGAGGGFDDERHLWPDFYHLIEQREPVVVFGEQVASKATNQWFDLVQTDLEGMGYAFGCIPFPSASVGAPHMRDRAFWVADTNGVRQPGISGSGSAQSQRTAELCEAGGLADPQSERRSIFDTQNIGQAHAQIHTPTNASYRKLDREQQPTSEPASPTNGFWRDADWLFCRDGKWRPVEPGTFPLVDGAPARVGRLRGYGNAINAEVARAFIEAYLDVEAYYDLV